MCAVKKHKAGNADAHLAFSFLFNMGLQPMGSKGPPTHGKVMPAFRVGSPLHLLEMPLQAVWRFIS